MCFTLHIFRSENAFVSWFDGRSEYLAEKGPAIAAIWTKRDGMIFKGTFGPWQGPCGNKYIYEDVVIKNFYGLLEVKRNKDWSKNRYVHKLILSLESEIELTLKPLFAGISVFEANGTLEIILENHTDKEVIFNALVINQNQRINLSVDGSVIPCVCYEAVRNQYGWMCLHQSHAIVGKSFHILF